MEHLNGFSPETQRINLWVHLWRILIMVHGILNRVFYGLFPLSLLRTYEHYFRELGKFPVLIFSQRKGPILPRECSVYIVNAGRCSVHNVNWCKCRWWVFIIAISVNSASIIMHVCVCVCVCVCVRNCVVWNCLSHGRQERGIWPPGRSNIAFSI